MKIYLWIKSFIYIILGILIIIFNDELVEYAGYVVGGSMLLYAFDDIFVLIVKNKMKHYTSVLLGVLILVLLSTALFILNSQDISNTISIGVIWGTWSIIRECDELKEVARYKKAGEPYIINGLESIVLIAISFFLILNPNKHLPFHMAILGVELILEIVFPFANSFFKNKKKD